MTKTDKHKNLSPFPKRVYRRNARIYKIMANSKRLEILNTLKDHELTVSELSGSIGIRDSNTSQHLSILRHMRLVTMRRHGHNIYYKLTAPGVVDTCKALKDLWTNHKL